MAFAALGGTLLRRILTIAIAAAFGLAAADVIGRLASLEHVWALRVAAGVLVGVLVAGFVGMISATATSRGRFRAALRRVGIVVPLIRADLRARVNGGVWFALGASAVAFTSPAFTSLPGGPVAWALVAGTLLGTLTNRLHRATHAHDTTRTFNLVAMVLFAGSVAAMGGTSTGEWWTLNFSTLGTSDDLAAACFNVAIVLSGSAIVVMARALTAGVASGRFRPIRIGVPVMRGLIMLLGACLVGVGLVPIDTDTDLHNVFALGSAACFAVLALGLPVWVRGLPRGLVPASFGFVAVEVIAMVAYDGLDLFTLTVFEMVAFTLVFAWLIMLVAVTAEPVAIAPVPEATGLVGNGVAPATARELRIELSPMLRRHTPAALRGVVVGARAEVRRAHAVAAARPAVARSAPPSATNSGRRHYRRLGRRSRRAPRGESGPGLR
ncbi:hypothetical protein [Agromyces seonyuensis]|uniref:hypothetical protein n=1 Tax=Agromyces seonyuensis TaxID=2662446 RepID=UPI001F31E7C6|nr:hypothetical protein [Agromyces seonyuensis]